MILDFKTLDFVLEFKSDGSFDGASFVLMEDDESYSLKSDGSWEYTDKSTNPETIKPLLNL